MQLKNVNKDIIQIEIQSFIDDMSKKKNLQLILSNSKEKIVGRTPLSSHHIYLFIITKDQIR